MTDVRVGDLIRATLKTNPEEVRQGRVTVVSGALMETTRQTLYAPGYDIEVLDRPAPPIDEELLEGAVNAYRKGAYGYKPLPGVLDSVQYRSGLEAVINYLRANDKKENYK